MCIDRIMSLNCYFKDTSDQVVNKTTDPRDVPNKESVKTNKQFAFDYMRFSGRFHVVFVERAVTGTQISIQRRGNRLCIVIRICGVAVILIQLLVGC